MLQVLYQSEMFITISPTPKFHNVYTMNVQGDIHFSLTCNDHKPFQPFHRQDRVVIHHVRQALHL